MSTDVRDRKLRRATRMMRAWRAIGLTGWLFFICSLVYISLAGRPNQARAIIVNGQTVLWVKDGRVAERVLRKLLELKGGEQFDAKSVAHNTLPLPDGAEITPESEAVQQLAEQLDVLVDGWKIVLEGEDIVTMDTEEHAKKVLEELKARYAAPKEGEQIIEQRLAPQPVIGETTVRPSELQSDVRAAAELLQDSEPETIVHVVQPGDTLYTIGDKYGTSLAELVDRNPQVRGRETKILPGEKLAVKKQRRGVKVITVKQYEKERTQDLEPLITRTPDLPAGQERIIRPGKPRRTKVRVTVTLTNDKPGPQKVDELAVLDEGEQAKKLVGTGTPRQARTATP